MSTTTLNSAIHGADRPHGLSPAAARRITLISGCFAAIALAAWLSPVRGTAALEHDLAVLLRGMAAIKATLVLATVGVLTWRLGHALPSRLAAAYMAGAWAMAWASTWIWQLAWIPAAAALFHLGGAALLITLWRDHQADGPRLGPAARRTAPGQTAQ